MQISSSAMHFHPKIFMHSCIVWLPFKNKKTSDWEITVLNKLKRAVCLTDDVLGISQKLLSWAYRVVLFVTRITPCSKFGCQVVYCIIISVRYWRYVRRNLRANIGIITVTVLVILAWNLCLEHHKAKENLQWKIESLGITFGQEQ